MAHTSFRGSTKRARLALQLKISTASTYGHLGLLWDYAYGRINIGPDGVLDGMDAIDIAMAAEWTGDADVFVAALCDRKLRFLDVVADGVYAIHDYQDWAPDFVCKRWRKDPSKYGLQKPYSKNKNKDADVPATFAVRPSPTQGHTQDVLGRLRASQVRSTQPNPTKARQGRPDPDQPNPKKPDPVRPASTVDLARDDGQPPPIAEPPENSVPEIPAPEKSGEETGPDLILDSAGSDRTADSGQLGEKRFVQLFAMKVCMCAGLSNERSLAEKRSITAVGRRIAKRSDRDVVALVLFDLAKEKSGAHLDNPMAAWQAEVNKLYPPDSLARPPTRNKTRRNMSMSNT